MMDTGQNKLLIPKHNASVPLKPSPKGLHLVHFNEFVKVSARTLGHQPRLLCKRVCVCVPKPPASVLSTAVGESADKNTGVTVDRNDIIKAEPTHPHMNIRIHTKSEDVSSHSPEEQVPIDPRTLEELSAEMVTFGKAHSGRSFAEVWDHYADCPDWTQWFFAHYQSSQKTEHRKMCLLIKKMIEESENNATYAPTTEASHAMPKSLAHPLLATAKPRPGPLPARVPRFQRPVYAMDPNRRSTGSRHESAAASSEHRGRSPADHCDP
jgi:hypothetical protein